MILQNKIVYIISHEEWGEMFMSKHHYAKELADRGNIVYFINHPDRRQRFKHGTIAVEQTPHKNIIVVHNRLFFPFFLKFKNVAFYNFLTGIHIAHMVRKIGKKPEVIFNFDPENSLPIKCFPKADINIYMPVDGPFNHAFELSAAKDADMIISVTDVILKRYEHFPQPKLRVNHGVANVFINQYPVYEFNTPLHVGYSGSIVRADLDFKIFLKIIQEHKEVTFEFWGENDYRKSTIQRADDIPESTRNFVEKLKKLPNVILHGAVDSQTLAAGIKRMDILLIAYNIKNDQNHHKVLEYLGTGKVIVSSYMSSYENHPGLIEMLPAPNSNAGLDSMFNDVVKNIAHYNSLEKQKQRIEFSAKNTYRHQLNLIDEFIERSVSSEIQSDTE